MKVGDGPRPIYETTETGFIPVNEPAVEFHRKCKLGQEVFLDGRRARNVAHHKKYWVMCGLIAHNNEHYDTARKVHNVFMFGTGRFDTVRYKDYTDREPHSISFASMGQDEFESFYEEAIRFLLTTIIPVTRGELERELMAFAV